jgi:peptidoglycan/xylan/chitin deacetylase (PgdA/CDA1 family)
MTKPIANMSLDLDNKWTYLKTHGDPGWQSFPSYLSFAVPRILDFLKERNLTTTVFIVGQDAVLEENREAIASIAAAGHEIANHSFHHDPWLHLYSDEQIDTDLSRAEEAIERVTGQVTTGFRGPGFSCSQGTLRALARRGYAYDCSTFPTYLGPVARAYYFMTSNLSSQEKEQRKLLFGRFGEGFRPIKPYQWHMPGGDLLEIPVTTLPLFKVPCHVSYLLYLSTYSPRLALAYWRTALRLCRVTGTPPSLLLHPLDFLGCDDTTDLSFFPAMNLPGGRKRELVSEALRLFRAQFEVVTMRQHAEQAVRASNNLPLVEPSFLLSN